MTKKILIVDDESAIRYALSRYLYKLDAFDIEIITAQNGNAAISKIDEYSLDLCFLDINLPDISGLEVMKRIKKISPETRIAIMTASDIDINMKRAINASSAFFIQKPMDLSRIKTFVMYTLSTDERERRKLQRLPFRKTSQCAVHIYNINYPPQYVLESDIMDISESGISILSGYSLESGSTVSCVCTNGEIAGTIRWSMPESNNYRAGIEFMPQKIMNK